MNQNKSKEIQNNRSYYERNIKSKLISLQANFQVLKKISSVEELLMNERKPHNNKHPLNVHEYVL